MRCPSASYLPLWAVRGLAGLVCLALALALAPPGRAATFVVNSTTDAVDAVPGDGVCATGAGVCTLRAAVQETNALAGADIITLPAGTYTVTIAGAEDAAAAGDLDVTDAVTINGAGALSTIVDGGALDRVFDLRGGAGTTLSGLTVQNGNPGGNHGGGIRNVVPLTLSAVTVSGNSTTERGGGIHSVGGGATLVLSGSRSRATRRARTVAGSSSITPPRH